MASGRKQYRCTACEHTELRWLGRCPRCGAWNTMQETEAATPAPSGTRGRRWTNAADDVVRAVAITQVDSTDLRRIRVEPAELARVLGGGLVPGSLVLLGGAPGVGKSTLLTTLAATLAARQHRTVYLSAEESAAQVRGRAERLGALEDGLFLLSEPELEKLLPPLYDDPPQLVIIDSIQTVYSRQIESAPGSVAQIRMCGGLLADFARTTGAAVIFVGHLTKEGDLAGPRLLEHLVDTVLYFEPEAGGAVRLIRAFKNRFGPTGEVAVLEMGPRGLTPVRDASGLFLRGRQRQESGSAVTAIFSGTRPFLVEIQALLARSHYGIPSRVVTGIDAKRVALLAAVLERKVRVEVSDCDIYVKVAGGLSVNDPAADLAVVAAMAGSKLGQPVAAETLLAGEVGLTGELRPIPHLQARLAEAAAQGFARAILPLPAAERPPDAPPGLETVPVRTLREALTAALGSLSSRARKGVS